MSDRNASLSQIRCLAATLGASAPGMSMRAWCFAVIFSAAGALAGTALAYQAPIVFFDHGSDKIASGRVGFIRPIAEYWRTVPAACEPKVYVVGHLDGSEDGAPHNDLDGRRATAVAIALREEGWTHARIEIVRRGFLQPLVMTGPGVREPQNRRVEIVPGSTSKAGTLRCWTHPSPYASGCERLLPDGIVCPRPNSIK